MTLLNDPRDLRIPGPTPVPPQVMEALQGPMVPHRGEYFATLFADLQEQLKRIHSTTGDVYVLAGTGSAGWEASIVNTLCPGDKVLAIVNGNFGERFVTVAEVFGMDVIRLDAEWGKGIQVSDVRAKLAEHSDIRAVLLTQNETSTGVLNPVKEIGEAAREHDALLFVDAVSGLPGARLDMDDWNCDVVFSGSQKAFMCPPGLSIIAVGDRVWQHTERASIPRYMLDFKRMRDSLAQGSTPSTAPLSLIYALKAACDMMEAEGMENVYKRHIEQGKFVRDGLAKLGLQPIAEAGFESPTVTAAACPEGVSSSDIITAMADRHGIHIAASQGHLRDSVIRIGHMGWTDYPELEKTLNALDDVLEHLPVAVAGD